MHISYAHISYIYIYAYIYLFGDLSLIKLLALLKRQQSVKCQLLLLPAAPEELIQQQFNKWQQAQQGERRKSQLVQHKQMANRHKDLLCGFCHFSFAFSSTLALLHSKSFVQTSITQVLTQNKPI